VSAEPIPAPPLFGFFERIGRQALELFEEIGRFFYTSHDDLLDVPPPVRLQEWVRQMVRVGVDSIPVVGLTAMFTGMVMALQTFRGFERFHAESYVASVVSALADARAGTGAGGADDRGPDRLVAGGGAGTMRVTEQIDAMYADGHGADPVLVVPRVGATTLMLPPLVALANGVGIFGGYAIAVALLGANPVMYWTGRSST